MTRAARRQGARLAAGPGGRAACLGLLALLAGIPEARAQGGDAATILELRRQLDALQRRLDQLESRSARAPAPAPRRPRGEAAAAAAPAGAATVRSAQAEAEAAAREARAAAAEARAARQEAQQVQALTAAATGPVPGLEPPDPVGRQNFVGEGGDALRSDLPGIAFRVPGTDSQVRLYGFAKVTGWQDFNGRNQSDAPAPSLIPLTGGAADQQGGDFGMSGRFSRIGLDTRTLTGWGTLETRLEGDFGGGSALENNAVFRLRQAWGEIGPPQFKVLAGFTNSLWNEGLFETIIDATNLNQSFVRQVQLRVTGRLAPGLTGQFSIEAPDTNYVSADGVFAPTARLQGGASPAFNRMPDVLGRLTYREAGWELGLRGLVRGLQANTNGTNAGVPAQSVDATGWGFAGHVRVPMRLLSDRLGPDELVLGTYYGEGIGRYFFGSSGGIDAVSNLGLPGAQAGVTLNPIPTWGATVAYRRFWTPQWRSNLSYSWSRQDFPSYALLYAPGSAAATALNRELQQVFANLIWSPFAEQGADGRVNTGWLDVGLEYLFTRRDIYGGSLATGPGTAGHGIANRLLFGVIARF
ncbi:hypothetical protein [Roseicella aquatilis]|uniref:Porin n=1 Tax=Roseicella aquatilis TaxID=2527868 RepID=A0A4R4DVY0_9PROT|nr:hypothetical protein [Roseicella aquatilis]TCZ64818.1 hypothetical protein EXY23_05415 [Roseicella aquatilis]